MEGHEAKATTEILKVAHAYWKWMIENNAGSTYSTFTNEFLESGHYPDYTSGQMICKNRSVLYVRVTNIFATFYEQDFSII